MTLSRDLFIRLTAGATFTRSFEVFMERWDAFLIISSIAYIPLLLMTITVNSSAGEFLRSIVGAVDPDASPADQQAAMTDFVALWSGIVGKLVLENLFYGLAGIFAQSTIVLAVAELYAGRRPTLAKCAENAISFFCNIFCAGFLVGIGFSLVYIVTFGIVIGCFISEVRILPFLGFLLAVVAVVAIVYVAVAMMIISPVIMVEQKSATDAIRRAWDLASGNRCFIYCTVFALALVNAFFNAILSSIVFAGSNLDAKFSVFGSVVGSISFLVYFPICSIMITVVYFKIRIEREGLDCNVLLGELEHNTVSVMIEGGDDDNFKYASLAVDANKLEEPLVVTKV